MGKKVKLTYFDLRGRMEVARLILHSAKQEFVDERVTFEQWPAMKAKLLGSNSLEELQILAFLMAREDLMNAEVKVQLESDPATKESLGKKLLETYSNVLDQFSKLISQNKGSQKFAVGKKLSLADIVICEGTQTLSQTQPEILSKYPVIQAIRDSVSSTPGIKEYLAKRPTYPF